MENPWKTLDSKVIHGSPYWKVRDDRVIMPNGEESHYYVLERDNYISIVAFDEEKEKIVLVKQWRYPLAAESLEVVAGYIDKGETPIQAAQRELLEEAGISAGSWKEIGQAMVSPGLTSQLYYIFLARNLQRGPQQLTPAEGGMTTIEIPFNDIEKLISEGAIIDSSSIVSLYRAKLFLQKL